MLPLYRNKEGTYRVIPELIQDILLNLIIINRLAQPHWLGRTICVSEYSEGARLLVGVL